MVRDLVVGDIIALEQGDRIPADCIMLDEMNFTVDEPESIYGNRGARNPSHVSESQA